MAEPTVRLIRTDEREEACRVVNVGMLGSLSDETSRAWAEIVEPERAHGAYSSSEQLVGLARWFPTDLSVPGGSVPAAGVTAVAVLSTHRRQGHLSRLMAAQLDAIAAESIPVALLVAAEWPIYGRFGYGPAIDACGWEIDTRAARFAAAPVGSVELVRPPELRPHLEAMHDARWARTPGAIKRLPLVWDRNAGLSQWPHDKSDLGMVRGALWRDASGEVQGAVAYKVDDTWVRNRPAGRAEVTLLVGATPEAERELWRHLCEIDWVTTVAAGLRSVDDPIQLFLEDGRAAAHVDHFDSIWARILDVPAALGARRSQVAGRAVVEVVDPLGYADGRWALELGPDGADVTSTTESPDVRLPVAALGAGYLGGTSVARLHQAGWLDEEAAGGVARLQAILATPTAPWSPTTF